MGNTLARKEKISWTDRVRNEVLHRGTKDRNILRAIKRRKTSQREEKKRREDEEEDASSYWMTLRKRENTLYKDEALDRTLRRTRFGRRYRPVVRQTTEWICTRYWKLRKYSIDKINRKSLNAHCVGKSECSLRAARRGKIPVKILPCLVSGNLFTCEYVLNKKKKAKCVEYKTLNVISRKCRNIYKINGRNDF